MEGIRSLFKSGFTKESRRMEFLVHYDKAMRFLPRARTIYDVETTFGTVRIYYYASRGSEEKVPLILLHGHYASTIMWQPNLLPLSERTPVYSVDLLGEPGRSRLSRPLWKDKDHAAWLKEVMGKLEISSAILMGSSMGGYYAVNFARYYPEMTEGLILLDPVFVFSGVSAHTVKEFVRMGFSKDKMIPFLLNRKDFPFKDTLGKSITLGLKYFRFRSPVPRRIPEKDLRNLKSPVLALMAGNSLLHDAEKAFQYGRKVVPSIEMEYWKNASHALSFTESDEVNERILSFLLAHFDL